MLLADVCANCRGGIFALGLGTRNVLLVQLHDCGDHASLVAPVLLFGYGFAVHRSVLVVRGAMGFCRKLADRVPDSTSTAPSLRRWEAGTSESRAAWASRS